jgi:hypothetical protein
VREQNGDTAQHHTQTAHRTMRAINATRLHAAGAGAKAPAPVNKGDNDEDTHRD